MRLEKVVFAVILGLCVTAQAQEDVYVDLSVLDNLDGFVGAPAEPLFPIVKPKPKKAIVKKSAQAVKSAKKEVAPRKQEPKVEMKPETQPQPIPYVESTDGIVVVNVEPKSDAEPQPAETAPVVSEQGADKAPVQPEPVVEQPVEQAAPSEPVEAAHEQVKTQPKLLVEEEPVEVQIMGGKISFAAEDDEISPEQMAQIDEIVGRFKNTDKNKIAIYAYNLDNGVDTFKKKRISLNRAVNVRGYLIKQGYKNFSIKVVNVEADSDKINTVELEEI